MAKPLFYAAIGAALLGMIVVIAARANSPQTAMQSTVAVKDATTSPTSNEPATSSPIVAASSVQTPTARAGTQTEPHYGVRAKTSGCAANKAVPDPACSPGAILTTDTSVICLPGYTGTVRDVPESEKKQVFAEYGIDWSLHSGYEVDHIISLELGGSNDISNLYPESYSIQYGARVKDTLENYLHEQVCDGKLPITVAQKEIATDWLKYYLAWQGNRMTTPASSTHTESDSSATTSPDSNYYTSSYGSSKYYYPASCSAWKGLSASYLVSFGSVQALLAEYPTRTLSPQYH